MSLVQRIKERLKEEFNRESPILFKKCYHSEFIRLPRELIMCKRCHRTFRWQLGIFGSDEIKLNKIQLDKLLKLREQTFPKDEATE